jgi:hypothetical protein
MGKKIRRLAQCGDGVREKPQMRKREQEWKSKKEAQDLGFLFSLDTFFR